MKKSMVLCVSLLCLSGIGALHAMMPSSSTEDIDIEAANSNSTKPIKPDIDVPASTSAKQIAKTQESDVVQQDSAVTLPDELSDLDANPHRDSKLFYKRLKSWAYTGAIVVLFGAFVGLCIQVGYDYQQLGSLQEFLQELSTKLLDIPIGYDVMHWFPGEKGCGYMKLIEKLIKKTDL